VVIAPTSAHHSHNGYAGAMPAQLNVAARPRGQNRREV
jgi:hypothetical protein